MNTPVCLFVYKRLDHTKKTIESLKCCRESENTTLFIFSDGAKNDTDLKDVTNVREYIDNISGFKDIIVYKNDDNKGLANSIINGVGKIINKYGKVIVIEDDLEFSSNFLIYMNECLDIYENNKNIWSISGYAPNIEIPSDYKKDVYVTMRGCSWGWATWDDRWNIIDWNCDDYNVFKRNRKKIKSFNNTGNDMSYMLDLQMNKEIDSWAIRWCYNQWKKNKYTIYPIVSKVRNIGTDNSGTHSGDTKKYDCKLDDDKALNIPNEIEANIKIEKNFKKFYSQNIKIYASKLSRKIGIYKVLRKKYYKVTKR
ncbi:MAG: sugar transferase [Paeniclostridium sordellii]|nr:sugar transferase [Paeniclostridium sordellii]